MKSDIVTTRPQVINLRRPLAAVAVLFTVLCLTVLVGVSNQTIAFSHLIACGCIIEEVSADGLLTLDNKSVSESINCALHLRLFQTPVRVSIQRQYDETVSRRIAMIGNVRVVSCFCDVPPTGESLSSLVKCGEVRHFMATIATQPSDEVLAKCIVAWPRLVSWSVSGGEYGDHVVNTLASRPDLRAAFLSGRRVSADAVERLVVSASKITTIGVSGISGMNEERAKRLSKTRSGVRVFWDSRVYFDGEEL